MRSVDADNPLAGIIFPSREAEVLAAVRRDGVSILGDPDSPDSLVIMTGPRYMALKVRSHVVAGVIGAGIMLAAWAALVHGAAAVTALFRAAWSVTA